MKLFRSLCVIRLPIETRSLSFWFQSRLLIFNANEKEVFGTCYMKNNAHAQLILKYVFHDLTLLTYFNVFVKSNNVKQQI